MPSKTHFTNWRLATFTGPMRALILSDLHIPYQSDEAVAAALAYGVERKANTIVLNGDLADFFTLSAWEKDPRKRDLAGEVEAARQFLGKLRELFPRARIIYKEGNHEERWERFLQKKAPELLSLPEFSWQAVYGLPGRQIEFIGDCRPMQLGKLTVIHGHEYRFSISNPVNPARGIFLRGKVHALCGHFHQTSQHSEKRLDQKIISTWSTGCLCDLHPDYAPLNNWGHGFAYVDVTSSGQFHVHNLRIIDGKVYA